MNIHSAPNIWFDDAATSAMGKAFDQACLNRIGANTDHNDWNRLSRILSCAGCLHATVDDDVNFATN